MRRLTVALPAETSSAEMTSQFVGSYVTNHCVLRHGNGALRDKVYKQSGSKDRAVGSQVVLGGECCTTVLMVQAHHPLKATIWSSGRAC